MSGAANAKRLKNEAFRDANEDLICAVRKMQDLTRSFDLDLVEALHVGSERVSGVAEKAMDLDRKMTQKAEHFVDAVTSYCAKVRNLRDELDLG